MASCELKNELAKLQEKKDKLANRAKNELALSELVLSGKKLLSAEVELLKIALGDNIAKLAQVVSTEYITVKTANEGISHVDILSAIQKEISDMLVAIKNDKAVATKLEVLKIDKPDNKYMLLDLNLLTGADGKYTQMMLNALNGDVKTARRQELLQPQIDEAAKELREIHGKVPKAVYDKKYDKYEDLLKRQNGQALSDAMQAIPALTENKSDLVFPSIMALTESEKSKSSRGRALTKDEHTFSSVATVALDSNTLVGSAVKKGEPGIVEIDGTYEVSPLGLLLGHKSGSRSFDLPDYVKNTIKINALSHMDDIYKVLSYEVGSQEFNEAWGIDTNTITEEEMALVQTKHIEGNIPQAVVLKSLGKAIYAGLPAKFAKNVDIELEQRAIVQLGLYAVRYMNTIGLVKLGESFDINGGSKTHIPVRANMSDEVVDGIVPASSIMNLVAELQNIGAAESRNAPRDVNEVHEVSQTIRNSFMETSETVRENLKAFENTEFKFNDHARLLYDMYTNNGKAGKEAAYAMAGVLSVDTSKPVIDQMKEMSKINYGKMQVDAFIEAYREFGLDGKPFKLPYDYTVSGRYMINSILNPQESKITRYLVSTKDIESVINVDTDSNGINTLNAQDLDIFKLGVSQAFDRDPDKHSDIVALEDLEKVVSISRTGQVDFVKMLKNKDGTEYKNPFKTIYDALNDGSLNGESVIGEELKKALMAVNRAGAGFHAMQAIMALKQLNDATEKGVSGPVALSFSLESDAITSGMILTLMQIGTPKAMELAAKGGVYTKEALVKWEKLHGMYKTAGGSIETLKQKDESFKLTHGWLLDFTADISKRLENKEFVEAMYEQLEPQTQEYIKSQAEANDVELMSQAKDTISKIADFKDFYNTVAGSANADMKKIKVQAQAEKDALMDQVAAERTGSNKQRDLLKDAAAKSVEVALIDVVGDVTRKLAKPSVMVYIYGAMLSSIKKKMVDAVVMPKVYDIVKKVNARSNNALTYGEFIDFINNESLHQSLRNSNDEIITQNERIVLQTVFNGTAMQFKKLSGSTFVNDDAKLMKNVIIPEKAAQKLAPATNETLGKAFETGFRAFGEIDSYRDSVKAAEVVRFTMFKYKLKQGLEKVKERLGDGEWRISAKDIASVIMQLEKDGFGHSVTDINGGRQPLYKKDDLEKAFITILATSKYNPVSSAIEGKEYGPNTGASGVITVHNIDGFIDAVSAKAFDLVRIYDGSVSGINKMNESLEAYNDVVLQTTSWNSYVQQTKDLVNQIGKLEENGEIQEMLETISDADRTSLLNTVQKLMGYGDIRELDIDEIVRAKSDVAKGRVAAAEAFRNGGETELAIMHSYLTDSADMHIGKMAYGEGNQLEPAAVGKLYEMYGNILHAIAGNDVNAKKSVVNVINIPDDKRYRKGSKTGDAKDVAMRAIANTSIVELSHKRAESSSATTEAMLPWDSNESIDGIVMLARNGELSGQALDTRTIKKINEAYERGAKFVVGDMPGVDSQFVDYLNKIGAYYTIYTTEPTGNRLKVEPPNRGSDSSDIQFQKEISGGKRVFDTKLYQHMKAMFAKLYPEIKLIESATRLSREMASMSTMFQLSNKLRASFEAAIAKSRPDLVQSGEDKTLIDDVEQYVDNAIEAGVFKEKDRAKLSNISFQWSLKGNIKINEDFEKVSQAVDIASKKGLDVFKYFGPNEIIEQYAHTIKEKPVDPDSIKEFTNKRALGNGVVVYDVPTTKEGQAAARKVLDTHFGEDSNPWCLLQRNEAGLTGNAEHYWNYYQGQKRIAFQNGKLVAFHAGYKWWDRDDHDSYGIRVITKIEGDPLGRSQRIQVKDDLDLDNEELIDLVFPEYDEEYNNSNIKFIGNKYGNGIYKEWNDDVLVLEQTTKNGEVVSLIRYSLKGQKLHEVITNDEERTLTTYKDGVISSVSVQTYIVKNKFTLQASKAIRKGDVSTYTIQVYDEINLDTYDIVDSMTINEKVYNHIKSLYTTSQSAAEDYVRDLYFNYEGMQDYSSDANNYNPMLEDIEAYLDERNADVAAHPEIWSNDYDDIPFQKIQEDILGMADLKAGKVFVDTMLQGQDTLPHEYAHHYISWFRDTNIVQQGIRKFGSEEALVQAIGEQSVKQLGEAYSWFKRFTKWLRNAFNKIAPSDRDKLVKELTDAFLTRKDISDKPNKTNGQNKLGEQNVSFLDRHAKNSKALSNALGGTMSLREAIDIADKYENKDC